MTWRIRTATADDAGAISQLNLIVQQLHHERRPEWFKAPDAEAFFPVVRRWLEDALTRAFIAENETGEPLGYVLAVRQHRPANALVHSRELVELDQLAVADAARGQGIGRALCESVFAWAAEMEVDCVELSVWYFNVAANHLFTSLGFIAASRRLEKFVGSSTRRSAPQ